MRYCIRRPGRAGFPAILLAGLALTAGAGLTLAKPKSNVKKHKAHAIVRLTTLDQSPTYPAPGSTIVDAGTIKSSVGSGAVIQKTTITGHPTGTTFTLTTSANDYYRNGTVKATGSGTATLHADGSVSVAGSGRYKGGSGRYKHAKGKFTYTGSAPKPVANQPTVLTVTVTGTISY